MKSIMSSFAFFFSHFPQAFGGSDMWKIFRMWGTVLNMFIFRRLNQIGRDLVTHKIWPSNSTTYGSNIKSFTLICQDIEDKRGILVKKYYASETRHQQKQQGLNPTTK